MATTLGVDISRWQDDNNTARGIDFKKMAAAGAKFVFIRSNLGSTVDEDFLVNWRGAKEAGLLRGAYVAYRCSVDATAHAQPLIKLLASDPGEMPPALDVERGGVVGTTSVGTLAAMKIILAQVDAALQTMMVKYPRRMLFYTNPDMIFNYFSNNLPVWVTNHDLWIAHYGVDKPAVGSQYKTWRFWQQTDRAVGANYGVESQQIDQDVFNGSLSELQTYCGLPSDVPALTLEERVMALEAQARAHGWQV